MSEESQEFDKDLMKSFKEKMKRVCEDYEDNNLSMYELLTDEQLEENELLKQKKQNGNK